MFLFIQLVCSTPVVLVFKDMALNQWAMGLSLLASSVITAVFYWWRKWWQEDVRDSKAVSWMVYALLLLVAVSSFLPSLGMLEFMGVEANEQQERLIMDIISSPFGFIVIALLVPLAEEIVFRGSILRSLLEYFKKNKEEHELHAKGKVKDGVWLSIVISSLLFGLVHGNIAQFVHATLLGILLGWIYYHTKSIVPGIILHFLNNGITFLLVTIDPSKNDASLTEMYDGDTLMMAVQIAFSVLMLIYSVWRLNTVFKKKRNKE